MTHFRFTLELGIETNVSPAELRRTLLAAISSLEQNIQFAGMNAMPTASAEVVTLAMSITPKTTPVGGLANMGLLPIKS